MKKQKPKTETPQFPNPEGVFGGQPMYSSAQLLAFAESYAALTNPSPLFGSRTKPKASGSPSLAKGGTRSKSDDASLMYLLDNIRSAGVLLNTFLKSTRVVNHAEILAFRKAAGHLGDSVAELNRLIGACEYRMRHLP